MHDITLPNEEARKKHAGSSKKSGEVLRSYTQNRELSWLRFNDRVLDEAADSTVPLLERLKFIAIFMSNLDEFFMIRVGSLTALKNAGVDAVDKKSGMSPARQLEAIYREVRPLYKKCASLYGAVLAELKSQGVEILPVYELSGSDSKFVRQYFRNSIFPALSPQIVDSHHPFPHLTSKAVYCAAMLRYKGRECFALIPPPPSVPPLLFLPGEGVRAVLVSDIIFENFMHVFKGFECMEKTLICVTRNADVNPEDESFDFDGDFRDRMKKALKKRRNMTPVRLEISRPVSDGFMKYLCGAFDLSPEQIYESHVPMDMSFAYQIQGRLSQSAAQVLTYPPADAEEKYTDSMTRRVMNKDVLLSFPYDSMDPFLKLIKESASDDKVLSIKITIYRLASRARLVEYLCAAAENGKDVTVLIELRARFDEQNNIDWSKRMEEAGCRIIYGFEDYKVHSKICLITRRDGGDINYITQIGTGNYNEKTSRLYTDLSLITSDQVIGRDADEFFKNMAIGNLRGEYSVLLVAPFSLKSRILEMIAGEASKGENGRIIMKLNSLTDLDIIDALKQASQAGARTDLIIRGICCLVPGVPGETENIKVRSIVGRFLEHSRIYVFGNGSARRMYISSADMMTRNTTRRVEVACPVYAFVPREKISRILELCLSDTVKARRLSSDGSYEYIGSDERIDCQNILMYEKEEMPEESSFTKANEKGKFKNAVKRIAGFFVRKRK